MNLINVSQLTSPSRAKRQSGQENCHVEVVATDKLSGYQFGWIVPPGSSVNGGSRSLVAALRHAGYSFRAFDWETRARAQDSRPAGATMHAGRL